MKKHLAVHFAKGYFLPVYWQKSSEFNAKVLPACWRYKLVFYFFPLHKIKNSIDLSSKLSLTSQIISNYLKLSLKLSLVFSACVGEWEILYPGSFQDKSVFPSFK